MPNVKPRSISSSNMVKRQSMTSAVPTGETNSASGSRSVSGSGSGSVIDSPTDHNSVRSNRSRPLARLDRLLRRWLPGYNLIRSAFANGSASASATHATETSTGTGTARRPSLADSIEAQRSTRRPSISVESTLPVIKRKDGEVVLDTGIAKSEFCMKLEKLLRAKLIVKD